MKLKHVAGLASFIVMSCSGFFVSWQLRDQIYHATPAAIFIACAISSILAGLFGWKLSKIYSSAPKFGFLLFPISVLALTAFSVSILYIVITPMFHDWDYLQSLHDLLGYFGQNVFLYLSMSAPVWLIGWTLANLYFRKLRQETTRLSD